MSSISHVTYYRGHTYSILFLVQCFVKTSVHDITKVHDSCLCLRLSTYNLEELYQPFLTLYSLHSLYSLQSIFVCVVISFDSNIRL